MVANSLSSRSARRNPSSDAPLGRTFTATCSYGNFKRGGQIARYTSPWLP